MHEVQRKKRPKTLPKKQNYNLVNSTNFLMLPGREKQLRVAWREILILFMVAKASGWTKEISTDLRLAANINRQSFYWTTNVFTFSLASNIVIFYSSPLNFGGANWINNKTENRIQKSRYELKFVEETFV